VGAVTATERLVDALHARDCKPRQSGGSWSARCPAHEDRSPSLSLRQIEGQALIHCHAGCSAEDVVAALTMTMSDLFDEPKVGARYSYTDLAGTPTRYVHRTPDKRFRQSGDTKGRPELYRLPRVVAAVQAGTTIYLLEGEKDVHALESLGVVATTAPMGASNFTKVDTSPLTGAHVIAVPDQDAAGRGWLEDVRAHLAGVVSVLEVARPAAGKDASDHLAAGYGIADLVIEEPPDPLATLDIVTASDVELSRVVYVWDRRIPRGAMTLMPGEEGIGKTTVGIRLMADLTRGTLAGEHYGTPRDVLVIATEDGLGDVVVPRFHEAGADLDRVHIVRARIALDGDHHEVIVPRDLPVLGEAVRRWDVALVWIDSLVTTLPDDLKTIAYKDTAKVLRQLGHWAEAERVAVAAPWHLNKAAGSDTAIRIMDSRAFRTAIRSMLLVVADPDAPEDGPTQGLVALDKSNAGSLAVPALRYRIRPAHYVVAEVDEDTGEIHDKPASCGVVEWIGEAEGDGRELARSYLAPKIDREDGPGDWLRDHLTEQGETPRSDVMRAAQVAGHNETAIKRAARRLAVHSRDESGQDAKGRPYRRSMWSLPSRVTSRVTTPGDDPNGPTGEGSIDPIDPIGAGQPQSGRSGQSGLSRPDWTESDPTGDALGSCASCYAPTVRYGPRGHPLCDTCREVNLTARETSEVTA